MVLFPEATLDLLYCLSEPFSSTPSQQTNLQHCLPYGNVVLHSAGFNVCSWVPHCYCAASLYSKATKGYLILLNTLPRPRATLCHYKSLSLNSYTSASINLPYCLGNRLSSCTRPQHKAEVQQHVCLP